MILCYLKTFRLLSQVSKVSKVPMTINNISYMPICILYQPMQLEAGWLGSYARPPGLALFGDLEDLDEPPSVLPI